MSEAGWFFRTVGVVGGVLALLGMAAMAALCVFVIAWGIWAAALGEPFPTLFLSLAAIPWLWVLVSGLVRDRRLWWPELRRLFQGPRFL